MLPCHPSSLPAGARLPEAREPAFLVAPNSLTLPAAYVLPFLFRLPTPNSGEEETAEVPVASIVPQGGLLTVWPWVKS